MRKLLTALLLVAATTSNAQEFASSLRGLIGARLSSVRMVSEKYVGYVRQTKAKDLLA